MLTIKVDRRQRRELIAALEGTKKKLPKELANAVNKTTKKVRTRVSRKIRDEVNVSVKYMKKVLSIKGRATAAKIASTVKLDHEKRPGVGGKEDRFKPKQERRGTKYQLKPGRGNRTLHAGAFMGPRPGRLAPKLNRGVFVRKNLGDPRSKIRKVYGVSPWGSYVKKKLDMPIRKWTREELRRQIQSRINTILRQKRLS